ncbi:methyl-accepting chemotaxis protein [Bifidobacterium pseudolongum subsp. globosum]|uniref:Methyl-accepting chemotaxis protein n=2 Tax=Bifidobacterium pseudolongum TaxID=1694 RepID=A0A4Q5A176_9BIFI|nr:methyl-accepting chemotaxis protein [Bifidobacterium pseudolongum subsp. globosum]
MTSRDKQTRQEQENHSRVEGAAQVDSAAVQDDVSGEAVTHIAWYLRIRWWGWVLIAVAAVCVVFAGTIGTQALLVKHHEDTAIAVVKDAVKEQRLNDLDGVVADMQKETRAARNITNGALWRFTEKLPGIKGSMRVVRMMTDVADDMAQDTAPKFADAAQAIDFKSIYTNGSINAEPIIKALPELETASQSLERYTEEFDRIPIPRINIVANTLNSSRVVLDKANYYMQAAVDEYIPKLPEWLGYEGKQTYAILAMTPGEMRASGGLIGAVGTVTIDDGKIEIGDFRSNLGFADSNITARNLSEDENRLYREEGPMNMNYDVRDIANSPDTVRVADYFKAIWKQTKTGKHTELNGIVLADPLVVQSLVKVFGDVTLPNGTVLTGANTADFLINTAYKDYPAEETDAMFGTVAKACVQRLMGDLDAGKMAKLASEMVTLAHNRHLSVYSFDPTMQQLFWDTELTSTFPLDEAKPKIGIYITENNPSKMGWYIKRSTKITQLDCLEDGPAKYHVEYTIRNTMTDEESKTLPQYITGIRTEFPDSHGTSFEKIVFMPPAGGTMSDFEVTGNGADPVADSLNYRLIYTTITQVQPESEVTYSFDVTVSPDARQRLGVDETPTASEKPDVTYVKQCPVG